jgi:hypothetical protein
LTRMNPLCPYAPADSVGLERKRRLEIREFRGNQEYSKSKSNSSDFKMVTVNISGLREIKRREPGACTIKLFTDVIYGFS